MFNNLSKKLKGFAISIAILGNVSSIIYGGSLISQGDEFTVIGLVIMFVGIISSWFSAWTTYALGELLDITNEISHEIYKNSSNIDQLASKIRVLAFRNMSSTSTPPNTTEVNSKNDNTHCASVDVANDKDKTTSTKHSWRCVVCDEMRSQSPCEHCGAK